VHRHGGAQLVGGHLGEPEVADLACAHQLGHRADGFLDRHGQVTPVHVVQVNDVGLQPGQAFVDALAHVGGVAADGRPARGAVGRVADDAELRRQRDLVPAVGQQPGNESLVAAAAVDVGGVDEGHAEVQAAVERGERFGVVGVAVGRQRSRAES
jgi:hypothetical protein